MKNVKAIIPITAQDNKYTCALCGGTFEKAWSDEEALTETEEIFGTLDDLDVVCDDCWQEIKPI